MIAVKENRQSLEQKIVELVSEYQALKIEQVEKYFGLPSETMAKAFRKLVKKGRISLDQEAGIIRESKDIREDMKLIRSFWLVLDFLDDCDFHGAAYFPLMLEMYRSGRVYSVFYCMEGDELVICRSIQPLQQSICFQPIVLLEDQAQIEKMSELNAVFCTVKEHGEVAYFTYES
mgnify:FL=1